jgi:hypothetical protein
MLLLAACTHPQPVPVKAIMAVVIPDDLRSCPLTPPPIPVPTPPRTSEIVSRWANATEEQRTKTVQALEVCRQKLIQLLALIERGR